MLYDFVGYSMYSDCSNTSHALKNFENKKRKIQINEIHDLGNSFWIYTSVLTLNSLHGVEEVHSPPPVDCQWSPGQSTSLSNSCGRNLYNPDLELYHSSANLEPMENVSNQCKNGVSNQCKNGISNIYRGIKMNTAVFEMTSWVNYVENWSEK